MPRGAFAAYALPTDDVCIVNHQVADGHYRWQHGRGHRGCRTSFSYGAQPGYGAAPPPQYGAQPGYGQQGQQGYGQQGQQGSEEKKEGDDDDKKAAKPLEWKAKDNNTYELNGESKKKCLEDCKKEPWVAKAAQTQAAGGAAAGLGMVNSVGGAGPRELQGECIRFCQTSFKMPCFPGSSTVLVRNRGRTKIADLRPGDSVLSSRRIARAGICSKDNAADGWELFYDTVLTFLDYNVDGQGDTIHIRHSLGGLYLTADHLIFAQRDQPTDAGSSKLVTLRAQEVQPGDHVMAPWIDGSVTVAEVLEVETVWTEAGMFAPLTASGKLLVDGTLASCYAVPDALYRVPAYQCLVESIGSHCIQETIHALFLPLRLSLRGVEITASRAEAAAAKATTALAAVRSPTVPSASMETLASPTKDAADPYWTKEDAPIHPYPWFLYVLFASIVA